MAHVRGLLQRLGGLKNPLPVAAVHGTDFVVSWNCAHIANARTRGRIQALCRETGYVPPMLCTPRELMEE
ncbi:MAG: hypothetical protein EXR76_17155 [Myxococcales bacterium]|nr:hypothetical protein [Myxococcales bacterium]